MIGVTKFGLFVRIGIVDEMSFINKIKKINFFRISFYELLKKLNMIALAILKRLCLFCLLQDVYIKKKKKKKKKKKHDKG